MIDNFLRSGFTFAKDEYQLRLKYQFFNLLLILNMSAVTIAGMFRFYTAEYLQAIVDMLYTFVSIILIVLARTYKAKFPIFVKSAIIIAYITVSLTFIIGARNFIGLGWYSILILTVFFLTDKKFSIFIFFLSLVTILLTVYIKDGLDSLLVIPFSLIPFIVFTVFVGLYDKRNELQKDLLEEKNRLLEIYSFTLKNYNLVTNLPNRNLFNESLEEKIAESHAEAIDFAILKLDIDNFKNINDSYGHQFGDKVLLEISNRLKTMFLQKESLSNIEGVEFIAIVDFTEPTKLIDLAYKIQNKIKKQMVIDKQKIFVTCSIGIAIYDKDGDNVSTLMKNVDAALHNASQLSVNNLGFYDAKLAVSLTNKLTMLRELKDAIEKNELEVYFQPQMDASVGRLVGIEALVRWNNHTEGLILPDKFIPLAENYGLIEDIDFFVLKSAMRTFSRWKKEYENIGRLAINLSIKVLENKSYVNDLKVVIQELDFDPSWLELEVTESHLMNDAKKSITMLEELNEMGIEIAIDDFGTGYSSLAYLQRLPVDKLKIDRSFILDIPHNVDGSNLVKSIINISQALKLSVIAEGVENEAQKKFLLQNGCKNIQGYYYSKPLKADEMLKFIKQVNS